MKYVWVIHWYDNYCPENEGCYLGIATTKEKAEEMGNKYIKRMHGAFNVFKVDLDKERSF